MTFFPYESKPKICSSIDCFAMLSLTPHISGVPTIWEVLQQKTADKFKKFPIFLKWSNKSSLSILNPKIAELYDNLWRCATASKSSNFLCVKRHKNRFWFSSLDLNLHSWIFQMCAKFLFLEAIGISSTNLIKKYSS